MNQSGCPSGYARDEVYAIGVDRSGLDCSLSLVAFTVCWVLFTTVMFTVAALRTHLIIANRKRKKQALCVRASWGSLLALGQSWVSLAIFLTALVVLYVPGADPNAYVLLSGLEFFFFNICASLWVAKVLRLGMKLIGHRPVGAAATINKPSNGDIIKPQGRPSVLLMQSMQHRLMTDSDLVIKVLKLTGLGAWIAQFVSLCVMGMIRKDEIIWLRIGLGLMGLLTLIHASVLVWQYRRCEEAIMRTQTALKGKTTADPKWVQSVRFKFRVHATVLVAVASPAIIILWLWAFGAVPITYVTFLFLGLVDMAINGIMLVTFAFGRNKRRKMHAEGKANGVVGDDITLNITNSPYQKESKETSVLGHLQREASSNPGF
jgi:hypothetical protein